MTIPGLPRRQPPSRLTISRSTIPGRAIHELAISRLTISRLAISRLTISRLAACVALVAGAVGAAGCGGGTTGQGAATPDAKVLVCAAGTVERGGECVASAPECPAGTLLQDGECVQPVAKPDPDPKAAGPATAEGDTYESILDPRRAKASPRVRALLITELQGLETLFTAASSTSPDRPNIARRLADTYAELEARALADAPADPTTRNNDKIAKAARDASLKYYVLLTTQYPKFCSGKDGATGEPTGCVDEARYYAGLAYLRSGEPAKARMAFFNLIQDSPQSKLTAHTYFQFGEMFRREGANDPSKYPLAEQSYQEALKYPGPVKNLALGRLAQVYDAQGHTAKARATRAKMADPSFPFPPDAP